MYDEVENEEYSEYPVGDQGTQAEQYGSENSSAAKPPKGKKGLWIGIITGVVVAVVVLAVLFFYFMPAQSPLVGKWHITSEKVIYPNGTTTTQEEDTYIVFNASGTGYSVSFSDYGNTYSTFTWKDLGNNKAVITIGSGDISMSMNITYKVSGNSIEMTYKGPLGNTYISYGERVSSIPSSHGGSGQSTNLSATLSYDGKMSDPTNPNDGVYLHLALNNPKSVQWDKITIVVENGSSVMSLQLTGATGNKLDKLSVDVQDIDGSGTLTDGDVIHVYGIALAGASISMSIEGYSGAAQVTVPS